MTRAAQTWRRRGGGGKGDGSPEDRPLAAAMEAYATVVEESIDALLQPLDVGLCGRLGLDAAALLAARAAAGGRQAAAADAAVQEALEQARQQAAQMGSGVGAKKRSGAIKASARLDPRAVVLPTLLPKAAAERAAAMLLAEAKIRNRPLPRELPPHQLQQHHQHRHRPGGGGVKVRVSVEERLVLSVLRDPRHGFAQLTDLAALRW